MTGEEIRENIKLPLEILKNILISNDISMGVADNKTLIFFGTEDYLENGGNLEKIDCAKIEIENLVR